MAKEAIGMKWQQLLVGFLLLWFLAACGERDAPETTPLATAAPNADSAVTTPLPPPNTSIPPTPTPVPPTPTPTEPVAASVNGQPVFLATFEKELARYEQGQLYLGLTPGADGVNHRAIVLDTLIEQTLIAQAAAAANIAITPDMAAQKLAELKEFVGSEADFQAWLQANQWTEAEFPTVLAMEMLTERMKIEVTSGVPFAVPQVHARYIQVSDAALAQSLLAQIQAGGDFAELARQNSLDRLTGENGGDLGFFAPGTLLVPTVEEAAFALEVNQVSDIITVTGSDGSLTYYIIQVLEKDPQRALSLQQRAVLLQETFEAWLQTLWDEAEIVRYVDTGA